MGSKLLELSKRTRDARLRAGLSQVSVANRIGKSKQLVSAWEAGRAEMIATTLGGFARIVPTDANWLLHGVQHAKGGIDAPLLPQRCALPLLSDPETIKHARRAGSRLGIEPYLLQLSKRTPRVRAPRSPRRDGSKISRRRCHRRRSGMCDAAGRSRARRRQVHWCADGTASPSRAAYPLQITGTRQSALRPRAVESRLAHLDDPEQRTRNSARPHLDDLRARGRGLLGKSARAPTLRFRTVTGANLRPQDRCPPMCDQPVSPLRRRMLDDMAVHSARSWKRVRSLTHTFLSNIL